MIDEQTMGYVRELIQKHGYDSTEERRATLSAGGVRKKNILDVGCSDGKLSILAAEEFGCDVTAVDNSEEKISLCIELFSQTGIRFEVGDASALRFRNKSFDIVVAYNTLHHIEGDKIDACLREMFRLAQKKVVITELNKKGAWVFDNYLHPGSNHMKSCVNLDELEKRLKQLSKRVTVHERMFTKTFVCRKNPAKKMTR